MENAVDALKMAGAAVLFIIAFTIAILMFSRAREASDAVLDNLKIGDFFSKVEALPNSTTRKVGIETIIPTLYRYCQADSNIQVRIVQASLENNKIKEDVELQVFDTAIESIVGRLGDLSHRTTYENAINDKYNNPTKSAYMFEAPWANQNQEAYRLERVNAYINGTETLHMPKVKYLKNNLMQHENKDIYESYLEYNTGGQVIKDNFGEEIVMIPATTKTVITYSIIQ